MDPTGAAPDERSSTAGGAPRARYAPMLLLALAAAAGLTFAIVSGGGSRAPARPPAVRPNLLLVSLDTTRADHLSAYGYARPTSPRLVELLPSSLLFDAAYTAMPSTMPSHSTMFTSLFPRTHGVRKNGAMMTQVAAKLNDREIKALADYMAGLR